MKIKLLTLTTLTLSFLLSSPPIAWGEYCYHPNGGSWSHTPCSSCESIGYKGNYVNRNYFVCMDSNCVAGKRTGDTYTDVGCQKCNSGFYVDSENNFCMICPQGATCDGWTITCSDGYYKNGSGCSPCHSSCKTCSGSQSTQCTSCYSGYKLVNGQCVKDEPEPTNTVNTCPSRMTLSADGCCCINKQ